MGSEFHPVVYTIRFYGDWIDEYSGVTPPDQAFVVKSLVHGLTKETVASAEHLHLPGDIQPENVGVYLDTTYPYDAKGLPHVKVFCQFFDLDLSDEEQDGATMWMHQVFATAFQLLPEVRSWSTEISFYMKLSVAVDDSRVTSL
jgi:hypothetical protein